MRSEGSISGFSSRAFASGLAFLDDSRQQKDAYLAQRLRGLPDDDRIVLEQAAEVLERILEQQ